MSYIFKNQGKQITVIAATPITAITTLFHLVGEDYLLWTM